MQSSSSHLRDILYWNFKRFFSGHDNIDTNKQTGKYFNYWMIEMKTDSEKYKLLFGVIYTSNSKMRRSTKKKS